MDRLHCALMARELGESLDGTAVHTTGWIAVEHPGPWTPRAPTRAELGPVARHLDVEGVRLQLIRPVGRTPLPPRSRGRTVLLGHAATDPAQRWLERVRVDRIDALHDLDPTVVLEPTAPGLGESVDHDVWLVCTHARRDACCALHGRPAALALADAGVEAWETTHTGGHRFAATAVVLPDGLSLGRLDTVDVVAAAAELAGGTLPVDLVRGRCAVPRSAQAAEVALRQHVGRHGRDEVLPHGTVEDDGDLVTVTLTTRGQSWRAHVRRGSAEPPRPVSDDADPTSPDTWTVTDLRELPSP